MSVLSKKEIDSAADQLVNAYFAKKFTTPLTERFPEMTTEDAYKIQIRVVEKRCEKGEVVVGMKAAYTNKAVQSRLGVDEPAFGHITDAMVKLENEPIPASEMPRTIMEAEIGFIIGEEMCGPGVTVAKVLNGVYGVIPCIEVAGGNYERRGKVQDGMANLSNYMIIGGKITSLKNLDLRHIGAIVEKNGEIVSTGTGAAALGNPVHVLVWLVNKISKFGLKLFPGMFVITGSIVPIVQIEAGDKCKATFDRLGSVSANFV
jgi:2-keto-4-pentenoate hydratase